LSDIRSDEVKIRQFPWKISWNNVPGNRKTVTKLTILKGLNIFYPWSFSWKVPSLLLRVQSRLCSKVSVLEFVPNIFLCLTFSFLPIASLLRNFRRQKFTNFLITCERLSITCLFSLIVASCFVFDSSPENVFSCLMRFRAYMFYSESRNGGRVPHIKVFSIAGSNSWSRQSPSRCLARACVHCGTLWIQCLLYSTMILSICSLDDIPFR
jgi:hypothetical protein